MLKAHKIIFPRARKAKLTAFELEESLAAHEVLVQSLYSIVSAGTECASFTGLEKQAPWVSDFAYPRERIGYGNVGKILALGKGVPSRYRKGDVVLTTAPHASHWKVDSRDVLVKVPDGLDPRTAVFARMAVVSIAALRAASVSPGDQVLVLGAGLVGILAAQEFQLAGADVLLSSSSSADRLSRAKACGVRNTVRASASALPAHVDRWTQTKGAHIVVETTGQPELISKAVQFTHVHGEVILLGSPRKRATIDITPMLARTHLLGITIKGARDLLYYVEEQPLTRHSLTGNCKQALSWLRDGALRTEPLLTHLLSPTRCEEAYTGLVTQRNKYLGVVFDWTKAQGAGAKWGS